jgi:hypothetical protein
MVLSSISFGGQNQGSGAWNADFDTQNALFLKVFGGEVMAAFEKYTVTSDKHRIRSISSGKSAQFPFTGRTTARRFKPGSDILVDDAQPIGTGAGAAATVGKLLGQIKASEKVINIDDLMIATCFIDELDQAKSHYDYRGPFSRELGRALAHEFDTNVLKTALLAAAQNTGATDPFATSQVIDASTDGTLTTQELIDAIFAASQGFDERYVPEDSRYVYLKPQQYYMLVKDTANGNGTALLHRDYAGGDSNGSFTEGFVLKCAGMTVVKTPHLPATSTLYDADGSGAGAPVTKNPGENNDYQSDFSNVVALCMHPEGVGTVKLKDLTMESEYQIRHQGDLMVAKMACGTGELRPECLARINL